MTGWFCFSDISPPSHTSTHHAQAPLHPCSTHFLYCYCLYICTRYWGIGLIAFRCFYDYFFLPDKCIEPCDVPDLELCSSITYPLYPIGLDVNSSNADVSSILLSAPTHTTKQHKQHKYKRPRTSMLTPKLNRTFTPILLYSSSTIFFDFNIKFPHLLISSSWWL